MIENTLENKAKFFALYLHQELCVPEKPVEKWYPFYHNEKGLFLDGILGNKIVVRRIAEQVDDSRYNQTRLLLKPLSSITDEDARVICDLHSWNPLHSKDIMPTIEYGVKGEIGLRYEDVDFLRSRGYLMPYMGLTPDEIIFYGWAKYKEV